MSDWWVFVLEADNVKEYIGLYNELVHHVVIHNQHGITQYSTRIHTDGGIIEGEIFT